MKVCINYYKTMIVLFSGKSGDARVLDAAPTACIHRESLGQHGTEERPHAIVQADLKTSFPPVSEIVVPNQKTEQRKLLLATCSRKGLQVEILVEPYYARA
jgi:hypothetical protein